MRPLPAIAATVGLLVLGCGGLFERARDQTREGVTIATAYPGASPAEVEQLITAPVELAVAAEPGVRAVESRSSEGWSMVTAWFEPGRTDPYAMRASLLERMQIASGSLPEDAEPSLLLDAGAEDGLLTRVAVTGAEGWEACASDLERAALTTPGVRQVVSSGLEGPRVVVEADPARLAAYGLDSGELSSALMAAPAHPSGALIRVPTAGTQQLDSLGERVVAMRDGAPVLLRDVATIRLDRDPHAPVVVLDGMRAGLLTIYHQPGADPQTVRAGLARALEPVELSCGQGLIAQRLPPGERVRALRLELPAGGEELMSLAQPLAEIAARAGAESVLMELGSPSDSGLALTTQHAQLILRYAEPPEAAPVAVLMRAVQALPGLALLGWEGPGSRTLLLLRGPDHDSVQAVAEELSDALDAVGGTVAVDDGLPPPGPSVDVEADRTRLAAYGLTQAQLAQAVRAASSCLPGGSVDDGGGLQLPLTLCVGNDSIDTLADQPLITPDGSVVPLGAVATITLSTSASARSRWDMAPAVTLAITSDEPSERRLREAVLELVSLHPLPAGVSAELLP